MYSIKKYIQEHELRRRRINTDYPILFNRINWDMIEENMDVLCEFQREHDDILPTILFTRENLIKIIQILREDHEKIMKAIAFKHTDKFGSYDSVYEFLQKYPEWNKLVFYDEDPNNIYNEFLTIHMDKTLPVEFNRINWEKVDQKIDRIYEIFMNQKEKITIPATLYMNAVMGLSEHYKTIKHKMIEYYDKERFTKNNPIFEEYDDNNKLFDNYDGFYHLIHDYPDLSDIVYFDPNKE